MAITTAQLQKLITKAKTLIAIQEHNQAHKAAFPKHLIEINTPLQIYALIDKKENLSHDMKCKYVMILRS